MINKGKNIKIIRNTCVRMDINYDILNSHTYHDVTYSTVALIMTCLSLTDRSVRMMDMRRQRRHREGILIELIILSVLTIDTMIRNPTAVAWRVQHPIYPTSICPSGDTHPATRGRPGVCEPCLTGGVTGWPR